MFVIKDDLSIHITRGDVATIMVSAVLNDGSTHTFAPTDVVRLTVVEKGDYNAVCIQKDAVATENTPEIAINLTKEDTKLGGIINKPCDYWYEIELNPDTEPQTIVGHDDSGPKIFKLYPEGSERV